MHQPLKTEDKRPVAVLIPFLRKDRTHYFFLQQRDEHAGRMAYFWSPWGGGIEDGESPEDAIVREVREELAFRLVGHRYFGRYEFQGTVVHAWVLEVDDGFPGRVSVHEGRGGAFKSLAEVHNEPLMQPSRRCIIEDVAQRYPALR